MDQLYRPPQSVDRFVETSLLGQNDAEIAVGLRKIRTQAQGLAAVRLGLVEAPLGALCAGEIVQRLGGCHSGSGVRSQVGSEPYHQANKTPNHYTNKIFDMISHSDIILSII